MSWSAVVAVRRQVRAGAPFGASRPCLPFTAWLAPSSIPVGGFVRQATGAALGGLTLLFSLTSAVNERG